MEPENFMSSRISSSVVVAACLLLLHAVAYAAAGAAAPDALVKSTVDDVLSVIKQNRDRRTLVDLAEKKVLPHFDFQRMTRLAVGKSWREASPQQRQALESAFRTLLVNTYTTALSAQDTVDPSVEVKPAKVGPQDDDAVVHTVVTQPGKQPTAVDYRMERVADGWKVYDVIVENLSLVTNYRTTFASEISKDGIDGLIRALQAKNKQIGATG
jgi:phospholipid transport system substrate-binding protein